MNSTRVFVIDDHPALRRAIISLLTSAKEYFVCGEAGSIDVALRLLKACDPDVVILDLRLKDADGVHSVEAIKKQCPAAKIIVFSANEESAYATPVLSAGAVRYLRKGAGIDDLLNALAQACRGGAK